MKSTYILYHSADNDGFAAATAAFMKFGASANMVYIGVDHGDALPVVPPGSNIYVLDFSYPRGVIESWREAGCSVVVIDHHKTAAEELGGMPGIHINQEKSAAVLAWEYFHPQTSVPELMAYVQVRDLWLFARSEDPRWRAGAREVAAALDVYLHTFTAWSELVDGGDKAVARLKEMGAGVLTLISRQADRMAGLHRWAWFTPGGGLQILPPNSELNRAVGYVVPVANASCFGSEVCEMLMRRFPSAPFVGYYSDVPTGGRKWGLRSRNNVDVSAIARLFEGGGGHLKAAGFIQTREHIEAGGRFAPGQAAEPMVPQPTLTGEGA